MSHFKPVPVSSQPLHGAAPSVTLLRWGASISLSLVLLACGGVADLQLGQDSNALESAANDQPNSDAPPDLVAPTGNVDPTTGVQVPQPGTAAGGTQVPGQVYLVDPATGQLFLPCEVATAGVATDVPPALSAPALTPAPTTEVDPTTGVAAVPAVDPTTGVAAVPAVDPTTGVAAVPAVDPTTGVAPTTAVPTPSAEPGTEPAGTPVRASGSSSAAGGTPADGTYPAAGRSADGTYPAAGRSADGTYPATGVVVTAVPGSVPCGPVGTASGHSVAGGQPAPTTDAASEE